MFNVTNRLWTECVVTGTRLSRQLQLYFFFFLFVLLYPFSKETPENKKITCYDIEVEVVSNNKIFFNSCSVCLFLPFCTDVLLTFTCSEDKLKKKNGCYVGGGVETSVWFYEPRRANVQLLNLELPCQLCWSNQTLVYTPVQSDLWSCFNP